MPPNRRLPALVSAVVEGLTQGRGWYSFQGGAWTFGLGFWALMYFQPWFLLVLLGISALVGAVVPPPMLMKKPRPQYETELE